MSKAVLLSIRPEWCKKILDGEKTVEVRRTCPVHGTPFKAYIYCTLAGSDSLFMDVLNRDVAAWNRGGWPEKRGRVIGEFTCKKITGLTHVGETGNWEPASLYVMAPGSYYKPADELLEAACMSKETAEKYLKGRDGYGEITSDRRDKLTDLWEAREAAQRKGKKDGKYHDLVTDMLARAIHSVGNEYADEIAAYEEERRMRRSYYEKVENRANGGASDDGEESDH